MSQCVYDFHELGCEIGNLLECVNNLEAGIDRPDKRIIIDATCRNIRIELNKFFSDKECTGVVFTENTDKPFFGILVKPFGDYCDNLLDDELGKYSFRKYVVEFDSKLFNQNGIGFDQGMIPEEIMSLLLYDIDQLTSVRSFNELKTLINSIAVGLCMSVSSVITKRTKPLFNYCVAETVHKMFGICEKNDNNLVLASELIRAYGLEGEFDGAFNKIQLKRNQAEKENVCETLALNWFFYIMKDYMEYNTYPIYTLRQGLEVTGSSLFKNMIYAALAALDDPGLNTYVEESKKRSLISNIKVNGMKSIEDDVYEYSMRVKNIDDESSAILLMRQINSRIGIIADYLENEELSDFERKRWEKLYDKYDKLREEMVKKPIYSRKMYGLFVDYNALMNMNYANQMTMNTMY